MKNVLKFKKTTRIYWRFTNKDDDAMPVNLALPTIPIIEPRSFLGIFTRMIYLDRVSAETSNGKTGWLNLHIKSHHNQKPLEGLNLISIAKGLMTLNSPILNMKTVPANQDYPFSFEIRVPCGAGFCETAVESVSIAASFLGVASNRWFTESLNIEQVTYVIINGEWIEYARYLVEKFPIKQRDFDGSPILREGGVEV